ncbi:MAG: alanine dehydrogenase [Rhodospirillaceae bacterium]|nr:alanine dehydrogenase [Rhodospirillaceae bacterium]
MRIGVPKEIKVHEYRVGMVPSSVRELTAAGHAVVVETGAGTGIGFTDDDYKQAGASLSASAEAIFAECDLIVKVKEPQLPECKRLRKGQILFTYLHLAADTAQADALIASGASAIAYETVTDNFGGLPLLTPMSEVAGRMSIQVGANCLQRAAGGIGTLLGGVPGVLPGRVVIIGGGISGTNAAEMAVGIRADVTVLDNSPRRLRELEYQFGNQIKTEYSTAAAIERHVLAADLVIGAVLVPGAAAPKLINRTLLKRMQRGSAVVDISIDQGGCFETSRPTTHADPTFVEEGVVHYCVANMPGAVPRTSTFALNNVTLPFVRKLAELGFERALGADPHLANGLNIHKGAVTHKAVADAIGRPYTAYPTIH